MGVTRGGKSLALIEDGGGKGLPSRRRRRRRRTDRATGGLLDMLAYRPAYNDMLRDTPLARKPRLGQNAITADAEEYMWNKSIQIDPAYLRALASTAANEIVGMCLTLHSGWVYKATPTARVQFVGEEEEISWFRATHDTMSETIAKHIMTYGFVMVQVTPVSPAVPDVQKFREFDLADHISAPVNDAHIRKMHKSLALTQGTGRLKETLADIASERKYNLKVLSPLDYEVYLYEDVSHNIPAFWVFPRASMSEPAVGRRDWKDALPGVRVFYTGECFRGVGNEEFAVSAGQVVDRRRTCTCRVNSWVGQTLYLVAQERQIDVNNVQISHRMSMPAAFTLGAPDSAGGAKDFIGMRVLDQAPSLSLINEYDEARDNHHRNTHVRVHKAFARHHRAHIAHYQMMKTVGAVDPRKRTWIEHVGLFPTHELDNMTPYPVTNPFAADPPYFVSNGADLKFAPAPGLSTANLEQDDQKKDAIAMKFGASWRALTGNVKGMSSTNSSVLMLNYTGTQKWKELSQDVRRFFVVILFDMMFHDVQIMSNDLILDHLVISDVYRNYMEQERQQRLSEIVDIPALVRMGGPAPGKDRESEGEGESDSDGGSSSSSSSSSDEEDKSVMVDMEKRMTGVDKETFRDYRRQIRLLFGEGLARNRHGGGGERRQMKRMRRDARGAIDKTPSARALYEARGAEAMTLGERRRMWQDRISKIIYGTFRIVINRTSIQEVDYEMLKDLRDIGMISDETFAKHLTVQTGVDMSDFNRPELTVKREAVEKIRIDTMLLASKPPAPWPGEGAAAQAKKKASSPGSEDGFGEKKKPKVEGTGAKSQVDKDMDKEKERKEDEKKQAEEKTKKDTPAPSGAKAKPKKASHATPRKKTRTDESSGSESESDSESEEESARKRRRKDGGQSDRKKKKRKKPSSPKKD